LLEETNADPFALERQEAQTLLDNKLSLERSELDETGYRNLDLDEFKECVPGVDKEDELLWNPEQTQRIPTGSEQNVTLANLLNYHFSIRLLNNVDNYYTCPNCRKTCDLETEIRHITLTYRLYQPPDHLIITLKRFRQSGNGFVKNTTYVNFPVELNISPYVLSKN